jgi:hypothetical protein
VIRRLSEIVLRSRGVFGPIGGGDHREVAADPARGVHHHPGHPTPTRGHRPPGVQYPFANEWPSENGHPDFRGHASGAWLRGLPAPPRIGRLSE